MKIALHAAELEESRIDGTRNYIVETLREWDLSEDSCNDIFLIHKEVEFNPAFNVPTSQHFHDVRVADQAFWTQRAFATSLREVDPDVLWMPIHNLPFHKRPELKSVVTVHDLAFKRYPETFPLIDRIKHNIQTHYALTHADAIIAVSQSTKDDILMYYTDIPKEKITVIHHGIRGSDWSVDISDREAHELLTSFGITHPYIIYIGAVQPRKNLDRLVEAFNILKETHATLELVLVGEDAWLAETLKETIRESLHSKSIIRTGSVHFEQMKVLLSKAEVMTYPSLYEGFGMPILEAFSVGTPVVTADNSSLKEVGGDAACYADVYDTQSIAKEIAHLLEDAEYRQEHVLCGTARAKKFSWESSARQTRELLLRTSMKHEREE